MADFSKTYPQGYLIFGLGENGEPLVYLPRLKPVRIDVNWRNLRVVIQPSSETMRIDVPSLHIVFPNGGEYITYGDVEIHPFVINKPIPSLGVTGMYYEFLDFEKKIFLIGFK
jgi:hypothetical protein